MTDTVQTVQTLAEGSLIKEVRDVLETYLQPLVVPQEEPGTGTVGLLQIGRNGVHKVPADIFDDYRTRPVRRQGTAEFTTVDSFIAHVNRFKDADSAIFANDDRAAPSLTGVLDYHCAGALSDPRFGRHRAFHAFPLSDEWMAWSAASGAPMSMLDFAAFLEDRIIDVLALLEADGDQLNEEQQAFVNATGGTVATPSTLMQLSVGLKVNENSRVKETRNLSSGEGEVQFTSEHETTIAGDIVRVPSVFLIGIPVFRGGPLYRVLARLRYRKKDGMLVFFYELWRTDRVFDHAFNEACERVRAETELPLFFGKPE